MSGQNKCDNVIDQKKMHLRLPHGTCCLIPVPFFPLGRGIAQLCTIKLPSILVPVLNMPATAINRSPGGYESRNRWQDSRL